MECRLKAKKCGGCPMLGLDYAEQLKQKEAAVRKLVGKYGPVAPIRGAENPCHYRNKVISTFAAGPGGKLVSGIYAAGTHKVLPVESCLLQDEVLDTVMQAVRAAASTCRYQPYNEDKGTGLLRHCLLRRGVVSGQVMVVLVTAQPVLPGAKNFVRALLAEAERLGKTVAYPVCGEGFTLTAAVPEPDGWEAGAYGIRTPILTKSRLLAPEELDLVLVPCTAFDAACRRVGMGKGYYDRYLPRCQNAVTLGVAFEVQRVERAAADPHDRQLDSYATEEKIYRGTDKFEL